MSDLTPIPLDDAITTQLDLLILAAGFEERARAVLTGSEFAADAHVILITFENDIPLNDQNNLEYERMVSEIFRSDRIHRLVLRLNEVVEFKQRLRDILGTLAESVSRIGIDVSGMPAYATFAVLYEAREARPYQEQIIFYTSANEYTPSEKEYEELVAKQGEEIDFIPRSMALEMDRNLIYDPFSGYRSGDRSSCLALFAGYELHRSTGVIDAVNPTLLLLIYGEPAGPQLEWRLDLSRRLHHKYETSRRVAVEKCSTQNISDNIGLLERYYDYLIDDYDLSVAPICSKMQVVATFLFWERYPEVQVTFPLPIGYDPAKRPVGIGSSYVVRVPGRLSFDRSG